MAQPAPGWQPGYNTPGLNGPVRVVLEQRDGDLLVGGSFTDAGGNPAADYVARWHQGTWQALGTGPAAESPLVGAGYLTGLVQLPTGDLVASLTTSYLGGEPPRSVVRRWHAGSWQPLGNPSEAGQIAALALTPTGELLAAFSEYAEAKLPGRQSSVRRWDGHRWQALGAPAAGSPHSGQLTAITGLAVAATGQVVACGERPGAARHTPPAVSCWNGRAWRYLGRLPERVEYIRQLAAGADGQALVECELGMHLRGGGHRQGPLFELLRWDGTRWQSLTAGQPFTSATLMPGGVALAEHTRPLPTGGRVVRWQSGRWQPLPAASPRLGSNRRPLALATNGDLLANHPTGLARYHAGRWQVLSTPTQLGIAGTLGTEVKALVKASGGGVLLLTQEDSSDWPSQLRVYHLHDGRREPVGYSLTGSGSALVVRPGGEVVLSGFLEPPGAAGSWATVEWAGGRWQPPSSRPPAEAELLAAGPAGELAAARWEKVWRHDGHRWQSWPLPPPDGTKLTARTAHVLTFAPDGSLLAGGANLSHEIRSKGFVARHDGQRWQVVGEELPFEVDCLLTAADGSLVAGGHHSSFHPDSLSHIGYLARWNGSTWQQLGPRLLGAVEALAQAPDGDLLAGGSFLDAGGDPHADYIARWHAGHWQPLGPGLNGRVNTLLFASPNELVVGGEFTALGDESLATSRLAVYREP
ncbi:MAG TPA: hypothetical protein VFO93_03835 [Hymenobacter sp.]|uniref:hypothetical protein n=1 Tax=Hymenobacter sp. TaxID=1898978 RepID=UPI002D803E79|nr:hypothetical protein [Hymenobacter sp.]HET9502644.1 hypothetical protein [Hymenobacter sp.]